MDIAYVDDSLFDQGQFVPLIKRCFKISKTEIRRLDTFSSSIEFLDIWKPGSYDLIILDIIMDELSGVELAKKIRNKDKDVKIVFCSTSNDFANESYDVDACYYMQKPATAAGMMRMIEKLHIRRLKESNFIELPDGQRLPVHKIMYAMYNNHKIEIMLSNSITVSTRMAFSSFCDLLKHYLYFCACNSGTLINFNYIKKLGPNSALMNDGFIVPVSRRRKNSINDSYKQYLFGSLSEVV